MSDFQAGLFPVRSPLLRESLLVSFPPLIDMLKLSGIEFTTACKDAPDILSSDFGQPRMVTHGRLASVRYPREDGGTTICDTQADVSSARRLGAQLAFKDSMANGIMQFTPSITCIAFRYHCFRTNTVSGLAKAGCLVECSLTLFVPGFGDIRKLCVQSNRNWADDERITTESTVNHPRPMIRTLHRIIQSVGATGGVYKGQGRSQRELMTRAY
uniref:Uncharacterized protein n=1 Tax=Brassica oleracea var. oleracea TaxID=109376 RepID=A0A0D2ZUE9_BRAOL